MNPLRVFIGYDEREAIAYHVLSHSILTRASVPVTIQPVMRSQLRATFTRERGPLESTDFSISRFLVPYLAGYRGIAIYMDCDMLCMADISDLVRDLQPSKAVHVVQHDYTPRDDRKFLGHVQTAYPRKNWSSLMVFDLQHLGAHRLRPSYVNTASGLDLHRFNWLEDREIGALPLEWNWLVGEYPTNMDAKLLHYTLGGPWFKGVDGHPEDDLWRMERDAMLGDLG